MECFKKSLWLIHLLGMLAFVNCGRDATGIVQGNVYDETTNEPLGGVKVTISFSDANCITSSDGFYELEDLGTYSTTIFATKSGYENYSEDINVTAGVNTHNIYMSQYTGTVKGYVYFVNDSTPISGVSISCEEASTSSSGDGSYKINNVPSGTQTLSATKSDFEDYNQTVDIPQDDTLTYNIYMTSSTSAPDLYGYVYSELDGNIQSAKVQVAGLSDWTDATGHYQIPNIPQGVYLIKVTHEDYIPFEDSVYLYSSDKEYNVRMLRPDTIILYATADVYTNRNDSTCYGDSSLLRWKYDEEPVGGSDSADQNIYINFDLNEIPGSFQSYDSVHLEISWISWMALNMAQCGLITEPWDESEVNWFNAPDFESLSWGYPDVSSLFENWYNHPSAYHGFVIGHHDTDTYCCAYFYGRGYSKEAGYPPKLLIIRTY